MKRIRNIKELQHIADTCKEEDIQSTLQEHPEILLVTDNEDFLTKARTHFFDLLKADIESRHSLIPKLSFLDKHPILRGFILVIAPIVLVVGALSGIFKYTSLLEQTGIPISPTIYSTFYKPYPKLQAPVLSKSLQQDKQLTSVPADRSHLNLEQYGITDKLTQSSATTAPYTLPLTSIAVNGVYFGADSRLDPTTIRTNDKLGKDLVVVVKNFIQTGNNGEPTYTADDIQTIENNLQHFQLVSTTSPKRVYSILGYQGNVINSKYIVFYAELANKDVLTLKKGDTFTVQADPNSKLPVKFSLTPNYKLSLTY